jgi:hypothetical protein
MKTSPKKGGACLSHAPNPHRPEPEHSPQSNSPRAIVQHFCTPAIIWRRWEREAGRLFAEYWRTANDIHLRAFATHVRGMRGLAGRRL